MRSELDTLLITLYYAFYESLKSIYIKVNECVHETI